MKSTHACITSFTCVRVSLRSFYGIQLSAQVVDVELQAHAHAVELHGRIAALEAELTASNAAAVTVSVFFPAIAHSSSLLVLAPTEQHV